MQRAFLLLLAILCPAPALAAEGPPVPDGVDLTKIAYYEHFTSLPPSRKCTQEDAKGTWKELAIYESDGASETSAQRAQGVKYLAFGEYNTLFWQRALIPFSAQALFTIARQSSLQYIATSSGMLYVYKNGVLQDSLLCFMTTDTTEKFPRNTLMLARPIEKDTSLTITLYTPIEK